MRQVMFWKKIALHGHSPFPLRSMPKRNRFSTTVGFVLKQCQRATLSPLSQSVCTESFRGLYQIFKLLLLLCYQGPISSSQEQSEWIVAFTVRSKYDQENWNQILCGKQSIQLDTVLRNMHKRKVDSYLVLNDVTY